MDERTKKRGLTRGGLIRAGAATALAVGAGGAGRALAGRSAEVNLAASGLRKPTGGPAYLQRQTYVPFVGSDFDILRPGARALPVTLIEAKQLPSQGETFSLLFRGRARAAIADGTYRIEHPALGGFELYVGPVGRGVKGQDFEAVINRVAT